MLHVQRVDHVGFVPLDILYGFLEGEARRVKADKDIATQPLFDRLLKKHYVVKATNFNFFVPIEKFEDLSHRPRS